MTEGEHKYKEELAMCSKRTFEKLYLGVDDPKQAPVLKHDIQDPFLDSEYTINEVNFAIKITVSN
jgi:hypothetical protein